MKLLMQKTEEAMRAHQVDIAFLGGMRNRYGFFGFEKTAIDVTDEIRGASAQRVNISKISDNEIRCDYDTGSYCYGYIAINGVDGTKDWYIKYTVKENTTSYGVRMRKSSNASNENRLIIIVDGANNSERVESGNYFVLTDIMISEEDAEYEAYQGTEITFSQTIDLYGKDGVQDVITPKEIDREFAKKSFDGTWVLRDETTLDGSRIFSSNDFITDYLLSKESKWMCTHLKHGGYAQSVSAVSNSLGKDGYFYHFYNANSTSRTVYICTSACSTVEELETMFADAEFLYELAEEVTEELPIADQIALNSLSTYDGITYVEFDSEIQPTFKAEYGTNAVGGIATEANCQSKAHLLNTDNPHAVTKEQIGLGNVENVSTNEQTPTYTEASVLANLSSGEKMSVAMAKMAKAISNAMYIVSFDAETGALVTKSIDYNV